MSKRVWRPKVHNVYREPPIKLDPLANMDWIFEDQGKTMAEDNQPLSPRDDIIEYKEDTHGKVFDTNIQWRDCPRKYRRPLERIIKKYWDCFDSKGMHRPIRGFVFHIDTGEHPPVKCKTPHYGPHEKRVIGKLVDAMEALKIIETDDGPYGSLVVLAAKPNQGHAHWSQYIFRMCVSFRPLNAITRPFTYNIPRCDDAVEIIGNAKVAITLDLDAGYWQVLMDRLSRPKTAFFAPQGKKRFRNMPMGLLNAHAFFVAMVDKIKARWEQDHQHNIADRMQEVLHLFKQIQDDTTDDKTNEGIAEAEHKTVEEWIQISNPGAAAIVDDVLLFDVHVIPLMAYFISMLETFLLHRVTIKLRKTRFIPARAEFVGIDVTAEGNTPAQSKMEAVDKLTAPQTISDWRMLIGFFGFYRQWLPYYEWEVSKWRDKYKDIRTDDDEEERRLVKARWTAEDEGLLTKLKRAIKEGPMLKRPDYSKRFFLKTDWSNKAMGAVLLQPEDSTESVEAMMREIEGGKCQFEKTLTGLRLRPICFLSRTCKGPERSYHSFWGEAAAGKWAMEKLRKYLIGREFTWITDCSGLVQFFERDWEATHTMQRWRMELLRYQFTIVHRPGRMLAECDLLSRYNQTARDLQEQQEDDKEPKVMLTQHITEHTNTLAALPKSWIRPIVTGEATTRRTELAAILDPGRVLYITAQGGHTIREAMSDIGLVPLVRHETNQSPVWGEVYEVPTQPNPGANEDSDWTLIEAANETTGMRLRNEIPAQTHTHMTMILFPLQKGETVETKETTYRTTEVLDSQLLGAVTREKYGVIIEGDTRFIQDWKGDQLYQAIESTDELDKHFDPPNTSYQGYVLHVTERRRGEDGLRMKLKHESGLEEWRKIEDREESIEEVGADTYVLANDWNGPEAPRQIRGGEWLRIKGCDEETVKEWETGEFTKTEQKASKPWAIAPKQVWKAILARAHYTEDKGRTRRIEHIDQAEEEQIREHEDNCYGMTWAEYSTMNSRVINRWSMYPVPTDEVWRQAVLHDPDLGKILQATVGKHKLEPYDVEEKAYYKWWQDGRIEANDGILYVMETAASIKIRQVRRRIVPVKLRDTIKAAFHSTPLAGHAGFQRTYWRISARYAWPRMYQDIKEAVLQCAQCRLANATNHAASHPVGRIHTAQAPLEVVAMDVWFPGQTMGGKRDARAVLTAMCTLTGFVATGFMDRVDAKSIATTAFENVFAAYGLPSRIMIDAASSHKGAFEQFVERLGIKQYKAPPEAHNAVMVERFHRYLNKIQRIQVTEVDTYDQWRLGVTFATYAWNASPIEGTDVERAFAAIGRRYRFPIENEEGETPTEPPRWDTGSGAITHIQDTFPLWWQQLEIVKVINEIRRQTHRELKNKGRNARQFSPGDLVVVRRQVQSQMADGKSAKLTLVPKGPYRVLEQVGDGTYIIQKIPATRHHNNRRRGVRTEKAFRMEKILDHITIHKRVDTADNRWLKMNHNLTERPLEYNLGFLDFGKYTKAPTKAEHAFVKLHEVWEESTEATLPDSDSEEEQQMETTQPPSRSALKIQHVRRSPRQNKRVKWNDVKTGKQERLELWENIKKSKDKLFFIAEGHETQWDKQWHLVQVDLEGSSKDRAVNKGEYHVRWMIKNQNEAALKITKECQFWPLIREILPDGSFGAIVMHRPKKVEKLLTAKGNSYGWYQREVNLSEQGMVGPFDFDKGYKVGGAQWSELIRTAKDKLVNTDDVHKKAALPKYKRKQG